jgi:DNA gyrase, A subunit
MVDQDRIIKINIEEEMKSAYIDYSMSVIVSRALPDVRDGFKPVHRRVLFGMNELGNTSDKPYKKSARIVGEVLGKYHPHGDSSVYHAMVRMAQVWSLRYPLVDGQGNFGSVDGDSPAAMRYTEARLSKLAEEMLRDIEKDTVDFQLNFDDTLKEPTVLPTRIPNLLVNGASGIAVGMATNMPPHNMSEVLDASMAYIDAKGDVDVEGLMEYVKAPDFPTGATIYGYKGVKDAFETGKGRVIIRGKAEVESDGNHEKIVITEIPYLVNKAELIKKIAELVNAKRLDGISNVNDESDRTGMRIVVDVKRDANSNVVINKLYKMTELQSSFVVNNIALVNGRPRLLNLKEMIKAFVDHRQDVVIRRTRFELKKAEDRAHILQGLIIASDNIDEVIAIIKASTSPQEAIANLIARFELSEIQARAIVEMRLRQLTGLEQSKLRAEYEEIEKLIAYLKEILENEDLCMSVIKEELEEVKKKYGDTRKTDIVYQSEEMTPEDFYADDEMIITISRMGYIKRTPLSEFRAQNRGGVGARGSNTRDEDFIEHMYSASMHNHILFFTQKGKCYWLKVFEIPEGSKTSKGRAIQNMLNIDIDDKVTAYVRVKKLTTDEDFVNSHYLFFCTKNGMIKRTSLKAFSRPNRSGVLSMTLMGDDRLIEVLMTNGDCDILLANRNGKAIRFKESAVRITSRRGLGVKGMKLQSDDCIVGMLAMDKEDQADKTVMVVSELGFGKRTRLNDDDGEAIYRVANRGGQGVKTLNITEKTGKLVSICSVNDEHDLMIINKSGIIIRLRVADIRTSGRVTQGLKLLNLGKRNDQIASICKVLADPDEELENDETVETADGTLAEGNVDTHDKNEESEEQNKED